MADLTEEIKSGPYALLASYTAIGLSLLALNADAVKQFSPEAVTPIAIIETLARNAATFSLEESSPDSNLRSEARNERNRLALQSILNKSFRLSGSETPDEIRTLRRRAAFALLVFAGAGRSRVTPG
jgi:hypothetical protein